VSGFGSPLNCANVCLFVRSFVRSLLHHSTLTARGASVAALVRLPRNAQRARARRLAIEVEGVGAFGRVAALRKASVRADASVCHTLVCRCALCAGFALPR